jgi:hypothetical protein
VARQQVIPVYIQKIAAARHVRGRSGGPVSSPDQELMAAGALTGDRVINLHDEELGRIEEIMLDVPSGRIAYAVMFCGGMRGVAEQRFAIPWQALQLDADNECFVLDIDRERLEKAPAFNQDHWPSMTDPQWAVRIHDYYGRRPYWE